FDSERLRFRAFNAEVDVPIFQQWWKDPEIMQYQTPNSIRLFQEETTEERFKSWFRDDDSAVGFVMVLKETEEPIGFINLWGIKPKNQNAELGILIGRKDLWGQGLGKESLRLMLHYAFSELNLHRVTLHVFSTNERAIRAYQSVGFVEEGRLREEIYRAGRWIDSVVMGILKHEYLEQNPL
ncbi:MAG: GNAT family N-acetyltransferase, partial [Anaerolineae bacterium]|nr:GNAT family N-acetyltransferase [Anaerolineae bacterium]